MNDVNGTALADWTGLSLKWSFTCADDSIEGFDDNAVPEPSLAALLGVGLLSVPIVRRRGQKHAGDVHPAACCDAGGRSGAVVTGAEGGAHRISRRRQRTRRMGFRV